jgi:hypothetical protein
MAAIAHQPCAARVAPGMEFRLDPYIPVVRRVLRLSWLTLKVWFAEGELALGQFDTCTRQSTYD